MTEKLYKNPLLPCEGGLRLFFFNRLDHQRLYENASKPPTPTTAIVDIFQNEI
jgi:hypothetical protein